MRTAKASALQLLPIAEFDDLAADNPASWRYFSAMALTNASVATSAADDLLIRDASRCCIASLLRLAGLRNRNGLTPQLDEFDRTAEVEANFPDLPIACRMLRLGR